MSSLPSAPLWKHESVLRKNFKSNDISEKKNIQKSGHLRYLDATHRKLSFALDTDAKKMYPCRAFPLMFVQMWYGLLCGL